MKNNSFFSVFLNIVLFVLLVGSVSLGYFFGNFDGISIKELKSKYTLKKEVKFADLPQNIQSMYINKAKLEKKTILNPSVEKAFDEDGNPLEMLTENPDDLKDIVKSLQNRILYLERENIIISNDKNEIARVLEFEKIKKQNERKKLLSSNLEKINEAEQQHYKNISELTAKLNDVQRENISLSQQITKNKELERKKIENAVYSVKKEKEKAFLNKDKELEKLMFKISEIKKEKDAISIQLNTFMKQSKIQRKNEAFTISQKNKEMKILQEKVTKLENEKNLILTKNNKSFLKFQRENIEKLKKLNEVIEARKIQQNKLKDEYVKTLENSKQEYKNLLLDNKKMIKKMNEDFKKTKTLLSDEKHQLTYKNDELNNIIIKDKKEKLSLEKKIQKQKDFIDGTKDKVLQLQDKVIALDKINRSIDGEVNERVQLNEEKHNKNYRILNERSASLELQLKSALEKNKEANVQFQSSLNIAHNEITQANEIATKFKKQIVSLRRDKENLKLNEGEKLVQLKDSFKELQAKVTLREVQYKQLIKNLKDKLSAKNTSNPKEKKKLVQLASIKCDNMNIGNFNIPSACKDKVDKFLNKYNDTHFFEIIPIVGTGGFGTLNLIKRKSKLNIKDKEIDRLTKLANLGLGQYRGKEAGKLIKEKFGDFAKISYAVKNIEVQGKRGFIIRAYK